MISRAHMRRQLRANGGITNARQGYGIGSWVKERVRKLIPNELANVAVKAAPFVAMLPGYGPLAAGIMRGVGRFDQRGSISDALKQGVGTYAGGKVFGKGMEAAKFRTPGGSAIDSLKELPSKFMKKGSDLLKAPSTAKDVLLNQAIIGGTVTLGSLILDGIIDEPEQQPGEDIKTFMLRRKESVSSQLKTYLSNTNPTLSDEQIDNLVAQNMTEYDRYESNKGGRVGLANGNLVDPRMQNSLQENIKRNNAARAVNQMSRSFDFSGLSKYGISPKRYDSTPGPMRGIPAVKGMRDRIIQDIMSTQQPYSLTPQKPPERTDPLTRMPESMMLPNMADGSMRSLAEQDAIRNRVLAAQEANKPTYQERLMGESWETLSDNDQYRIAQEYPGETPPRRNPSFVPNYDAGLSGQEIAEKYGIPYAKGGRVGLAEGSDDMILPMKKPQVNNLDELPRGLQIDTTTSAYGKAVPEGTPIPEEEKSFKENLMFLNKIKGGVSPSTKIYMLKMYMDEALKKGQITKEQYTKMLMPFFGKGGENVTKDFERYEQQMNKGGLMRLNYMIGGEAKQMEAGAPPIMYSGNMDPNAPNQQAGLPAVPGPMQMAPDGPEFDMRENGGFQPLGRQEGKDDVPAMLAKNEFVMTADAVRAAGGGSVQKGAQRMYDTMKKLESRVS